MEFGYEAMNDIMRAIKELRPAILSQTSESRCTMELSIRESLADELTARLRKAAEKVETDN